MCLAPATAAACCLESSSFPDTLPTTHHLHLFPVYLPHSPPPNWVGSMPAACEQQQGQDSWSSWIPILLGSDLHYGLLYSSAYSSPSCYLLLYCTVIHTACLVRGTPYSPPPGRSRSSAITTACLLYAHLFCMPLLYQCQKENTSGLNGSPLRATCAPSPLPLHRAALLPLVGPCIPLPARCMPTT